MNKIDKQIPYQVFHFWNAVSWKPRHTVLNIYEESEKSEFLAKILTSILHLFS